MLFIEKKLAEMFSGADAEPEAETKAEEKLVKFCMKYSSNLGRTVVKYEPWTGMSMAQPLFVLYLTRADLLFYHKELQCLVAID